MIPLYNQYIPQETRFEKIPTETAALSESAGMSTETQSTVSAVQESVSTQAENTPPSDQKKAAGKTGSLGSNSAQMQTIVQRLLLLLLFKRLG